MKIRNREMKIIWVTGVIIILLLIWIDPLTRWPGLFE